MYKMELPFIKITDQLNYIDEYLMISQDICYFIVRLRGYLNIVMKIRDYINLFPHNQINYKTCILQKLIYFQIKMSNQKIYSYNYSYIIALLQLMIYQIFYYQHKINLPNLNYHNNYQIIINIHYSHSYILLLESQQKSKINPLLSF